MGKSSKSLISTILFWTLQVVLVSALVYVFVPPVRVGVNANFPDRQTPNVQELHQMVLGALEHAATMQLMSVLSEEVEVVDAGESLAAIDDFLDANPMQSIRIVNSHWSTVRRFGRKSRRIDTVRLESTHHDRFGHWFFSYVTEGEKTLINGFNLMPLGIPMSESNRSHQYYFDRARITWIVFATAILLSVVLTLWHYYRLSPFPRAVPMLILMISFVRVMLDWNSLNLSIGLFQASLLPVGVSRVGSAEVWQLRVFIPVFVVLYWLFWRKRLFAKDERKRVTKQGDARALNETPV